MSSYDASYCNQLTRKQGFVRERVVVYTDAWISWNSPRIVAKRKPLSGEAGAAKHTIAPNPKFLLINIAPECRQRKMM